MKRLIEQRYTIRHNIIAVIGMILFCYFTYHSFFGERSFLSLLKFNHQIETRLQTHNKLAQQRNSLEERVVRLRPETLDRDLLEERARHVLGHTYPEETVILYGQKQNI